MAFYSYIFSANYKRFFNNLKKVAKEEKKFFPFLVLDTGWCVLRYGMALTDYLVYKAYKKGHKERMEYAGIRRQNDFYELVSPSAYKKRYTVKPIFMGEFKEYTKRDFVIPGEDNFQQFCDFLDTHEVFMVKPYDGLGGKGIYKCYAKDVQDRKALFDDCVENRMFVEDLIRQHPGMNELCAKSVNTMRIITFNDHGKSEVVWICLRVGNGYNDVDNFSSQGMAVKVDVETGCVVGNALNGENQEFTHHPVTGVKFDGFRIPCFQQAKDLVLKASLESDKILVVGWDVAISEDGPVVVEGNRRPGLGIVQQVEGRGRMDIVRDITYRAKTAPEDRK